MNIETVQFEQQINYHYVKLPRGGQFKVFNQLDNQKHMCNFFIHKSDIYNYTELSNKVRIGENFIVVAKKVCIRNKNNLDWYNVGIKVFGTYYVFYFGDRIKATGFDAMIKTNMYQFHRLNTLHRQFEKWQSVEPRLRKFKNREEFLADVDAQYQTELKQIAKLKAEYQASIKAIYSAKNAKKQIQENYSLVNDYNKQYEKVKAKPQESSGEEISQLLTELDDPILK